MDQYGENISHVTLVRFEAPDGSRGAKSLNIEFAVTLLIFWEYIPFFIQITAVASSTYPQKLRHRRQIIGILESHCLWSRLKTLPQYIAQKENKVSLLTCASTWGSAAGHQSLTHNISSS